MSWFNTTNFSDLASKAIKNAQKTIDKALDIKEGDKKAAASTGNTCFVLTFSLEISGVVE